MTSTIPLRDIGRLIGALLVTAGLLAVGRAGVAPAEAAPLLRLQVTALAGPARLAPGATGAYTVTIHNPNTEHAFEQVLIVFNAFGPLASAGPAPVVSGFDCYLQEAGANISGGFYCANGTLPPLASVSVTFTLRGGVGGQGTISASTESGKTPGVDNDRRLDVAVADRLVRAGERGEVVTTVQYLLRAHGHDIAVDGVFGPQTLEAVRAFQRAGRLTVDGVVGAQTWAALFVTVQQGSQGEAVRAVQGQLASRGVAITVDGDFGPQTDAAVRAYQQRTGLSADGVVGPQTWSALVSGR